VKMATQGQAVTKTSDAKATGILDDVIKTTESRPGVVRKFAEAYDLDPAKVMSIVSQTVFRPGKEEPPLTPEETAAALIVCNAYGLNPFTKEIYAFRSKGKLLIVVGVDGWSAIVNRQAAFDGVEFDEHFDEKGNIEAVTCRIYRKDRSRPTSVTEWTRECKRNTDPWNMMPVRMTRNRSFVQCARIAFSISGIVDDDEATGIEGNPYNLASIDLNLPQNATRTDAVKAAIADRKKRGEGKAASQTDTRPTEVEPTTAIASTTQSAEPSHDISEVQQEQSKSDDQSSGSLW
jgi:phage recombination protein Bet